jgi:hypothetical protein
LEYRFINRKTDLDRILEEIERFFQKRDFRTRKELSDNTVHLAAFKHSAKGDSRRVEVEISREPDCLAIKFVTEKNPLLTSPMNSMVSFMGGGFLVKRELEASEFYRKLEDDFWKDVDEVLSEFPTK